MIALREGQPHGQGSGRSVPGFKLHEALQECTAHLVGHGGHAAAAAPAVPYDQQITNARALVNQDPKRVAQVVRNWVSVDE